MGLFDFFSGKNSSSGSQGNRRGSQAGRRVSPNRGRETPQQFQTTCAIEFLNVAKEEGLAYRDLITVPELYMLGQQVAVSYLRNQELFMRYRQNPGLLYSVIMNMCFQAGMLIAMKWHTDFNNLNSYVSQVMAYGPATESIAMKERIMGMTDSEVNGFCNAMAIRWDELMKPYFSMPDQRPYIMAGETAAYLVGVSVMMEKNGFR